MNETPKTTKSGWRILRRILISLAVLVTLVALFYTEEDWRGKRDWEKCKAEFEAKGVMLDWNAYIPPPVPAGQNFFMAPKMQEWFQGRGSRDLTKRLENPKTVPVGEKDKIKTEADAKAYLAWSDQFTPDFNLIREALKRPYARMVGDYTQPYAVPIPNFLTVRIVAQTLAQRAHCYLLLGEPQKALEELTFLNDSRRLLEGAPTGKPMTFLASMINVAVTGLYADIIAQGFRLHAWQDSQLVSLQEQLSKIDLIPYVSESSRETPVHDYQVVKQLEVANRLVRERLVSLLAIPNSWKKSWNNPVFLLFNIAPKGWIDQNLIVDIRSEVKMLDALDTSNSVIFPRRIDATLREIKSGNSNHSPYRILASFAIPNYSRAFQTLAYYQTEINEAAVACALERYHLAHGNYPETLDALVPRFIQKLPHDIIGGQPLHYRRITDGKFMLYSVGWNETDNGGEPGTLTDPEQGDWVWEN